MIKLDLGAGNKRREGYVSVDVAGSPDVKADLRKLPFDDGHADVVEAIHVIEHFYYWEVQAILSEWRRVLKPGGKIVLECPDIEKACINYFKYVGEENMSMWAFYGDPRLRDPLHCHKWGYTPNTLRRELLAAGFNKVEEKPAQFHKRDLRDMRMEGYK